MQSIKNMHPCQTVRIYIKKRRKKENSTVLRTSGLCSINLNNALDALTTDRTKIDLLCTSHTCANVAAITEHSVLLLRVTDLAQIHFFIGYFQVMDAFTMTFAILEAANVLVARLLLSKGSMAMANILHPVTIVGVASWVVHFALAMAASENEVALVYSARC